MNFKILLLLCSFFNFNVYCNTESSAQPIISIEVFGLLVALECKVVFNVLKKLPESHPLLKSENQLYKALEVTEKQFSVHIVADKNTDSIVMQFDPELYQAVYYVTYTELDELNVPWSVNWKKLCDNQQELNRFIKFFTAVSNKVERRITTVTNAAEKEALQLVLDYLKIDLSHFTAIVEKIEHRHIC
jgi:hypothetical protein